MTAAAPSFRVRQLRAGYGRREVVRGVSLEPIPLGETVALIGPNAAGKSTLLKALAGLVPAAGGIAFGATDLLTASASARSALVGFMPQTLPGGIRLTVLESVVSALRAAPTNGRRLGAKEAEERAAKALTDLGLAPLALVPLDRLSGGQRQLAGFAQAVAREPRILLLDEPTSALDLRHQVEVVDAARRFAAGGRIVVVVLHDLGLAARWASRIVVMRDGQSYAEGAPAAVLTARMLAEVYGVEGRVVDAAGDLQIAIDGAAAPAEGRG